MPDDLTHLSGDGRLDVSRLIEEGRAYHAQGDLSRAESAYREALEGDPKEVEALYLLGLLAHQCAQPKDAVSLLERAAELDAGNSEVFATLCAVYRTEGRLEESVTTGRMAVTLDSSNGGARINLANALIENLQARGALTELHAVLEQEPENPLALAAAIRACLALGSTDEALANCDLLAAAHPEWPHGHYLCGVVAAEIGDKPWAQSSFYRAIELNPQDGDAWYQYVQAGGRLEDSVLGQLEELAADVKVAPAQRAPANFALGFWKKSDPEEAFKYLSRANDISRMALRAGGMEFSAVAHDQLISKLEVGLSRWAPGASKLMPSDSAAPIFVVGLPRSGTTLVEQLLAGHADVSGVGEQKFMPALAEKLLSEQPVSQDVAVDYLGQMDGLSGGTERFVDKMPFNYLYLELIQHLFPNARVIACRRDPRATALSIYEQHFADGLPWTTSLTDIGTYMAAYQRLFQVWDSKLPIPIEIVEYEELVATPEHVGRRISEYLDLAWAPEMLDFHTSNAQVQSASKWQIRQPIYTSSARRWQAYEDELEPFVRSFLAAGGEI